MYSIADHSFVICAYKKSPYLEECIKSLMDQKSKSNILMVTSTPSKYVEELANRYGIELFINTGETGIAEDWNFAISKATTRLVTIAHQDDTYEPEYSQKIVEAFNWHNRSLIAFSDYGEIRNGSIVDGNCLLYIKRLLLRKLKKRKHQNEGRYKKGALRFGSAICCPSVTINIENVKQPVFRHRFRSNVDWQAWASLTSEEGAFCYVPEVLMHHRIHEESETSVIIAEKSRTDEDYEMFCYFWPPKMAKVIAYIYRLAEKSNDV